MKRIKLFGLSLVAVFAFSAIGAAVAAAHEPVWYVKGVELAAGKSEPFTSTSKESKLSSIDGNIICKSDTDTGKIIGGVPGTDETTVVYKECVIEGRTATECNVHTGTKTSEIETSVLKSKLVWLKEEGEQAGDLLEGPSEVFVTIDATPKATGDCGKFPETFKVLGQIVCELLPVGAERETGEIVCPTTEIKSYFTGDPKTRSKHTVVKLEAFGSAADYTGTDDVTLTSKSVFGVFPEKKEIG